MCSVTSRPVLGSSSSYPTSWSSRTAISRGRRPRGQGKRSRRRWRRPRPTVVPGSKEFHKPEDSIFHKTQIFYTYISQNQRNLYFKNHKSLPFTNWSSLSFTKHRSLYGTKNISLYLTIHKSPSFMTRMQCSLYNSRMVHAPPCCLTKIVCIFESKGSIYSLFPFLRLCSFLLYISFNSFLPLI